MKIKWNWSYISRFVATIKERAEKNGVFAGYATYRIAVVLETKSVKYVDNNFKTGLKKVRANMT